METKTIKLHKYQDSAIFAPDRFVALVAGIQSGKTVAGAVWSRKRYDEFKDEDMAILAPTYKILTQSTLPKFFEINDVFKPYYKKSDSVIECPDRKGKIYIRSTENPNVIEGMTLRSIWADEAGQMSLDAWVNMQGRVSFKQGSIMLTTTPYSMNWLYFDFYEHARKNTPGYKLVQFRSIDSPYFPQEEFERVRTTMDRRVFERRYCGSFTKMEGVVYQDFDQARHTTKEIPKKFEIVLCGVDWGYTAPAGMAVWGQSDGKFYLIDEFKQSQMTTPELVEKAKALQREHGINRFYADTAEPDRIRAFRDAGLYCLESDKDIVRGIDKLRQLIREDRIRVRSSCINFLDEIESYHYPEPKDDRDEGKEIPEKMNDHLLDATRYVFSTYYPQSASVAKSYDDREFEKRMREKRLKRRDFRMA